MRPVFEHALVAALGLPQIGAAIVGDAGVEDVVVAALDHVDGVDLHIAEMGDRIRDRLRSLAERRRACRAAARRARCGGRRACLGREISAGGTLPTILAGFAGARKSRIGRNANAAVIPAGAKAAFARVC